MNVQFLGVVHASSNTRNSMVAALTPLGSYCCFDGLIRAKQSACTSPEQVEHHRRRVERVKQQVSQCCFI